MLAGTASACPSSSGPPTHTHFLCSMLRYCLTLSLHRAVVVVYAHANQQLLVWDS